MIMIVYFLQITVFRADRTVLSGDLGKIFKFTPGSALFAIDMLGYAFLSLSAFFCAFVFDTQNKLEKSIKILLLINGVFVISSIIFPIVYYPKNFYSQETTNFAGSLGYIIWSLLFSTIAILFFIFYKKLLDKIKKSG
jgi:hypothetical protein